MTGGRTEQLDIIAGFLCITDSDFLSFIFVEHIRFFQGAIQLSVSWKQLPSGCKLEGSQCNGLT